MSELTHHPSLKAAEVSGLTDTAVTVCDELLIRGGMPNLPV